MRAVIRAALAALIAFCAAAPALAGSVRQVDPFWPLSTPTSGCWTVKVDGLPPSSVQVLQPGYDSNAAPVLRTATLSVTAQVRQPYSASLNQTDRWALSDYVYAGETIPGVSNLCTTPGPTPVANWSTLDRYALTTTIGGSSFPVAVVAFSRDAGIIANREVAAVVFRICDTVPTCVNVTVSSPTKSTDTNPIEEWVLPSTSISGLADGAITVNAEVYPLRGGALQVARSVNSSERRGFSPRYFQKNAASGANPFRIYVVDTGGNNTTCVASRTDATAAASPCASITGAWDRAQALSADFNDLEIRFKTATTAAFTLSGNTAGTLPQNGGCVTITRDPGTPRANLTINFGNQERARLTPSGAVPTGCLRFSDLNMTRTVNLTIRGDVTFRQDIQMVNVAANMGAFATTLVEQSDFYWKDVTFSNIGAGAFSASGSQGQHRYHRNLSGLDNAGAVEGYLMLGFNMTAGNGQIVGSAFSGATHDGSILYGMRYRNVTNTTNPFISWSSAIPTGAAMANVEVEYNGAAAREVIGISHDGLTNSTSNVILHYLTVTGAFGGGRLNLLYDDGATARVNRFQSCRGLLIQSQLNLKSDIFRGSNEAGPDASYRTGNWAFTHGVGCQRIVTGWADANNGSGPGGQAPSFKQVYPGAGSVIGTATSGLGTPSIPTTDYVSYVATTYNGVSYSSGGGSGNYDLNVGASVIGGVTAPMLGFDITGQARPTSNDAPGANVPG